MKTAHRIQRTGHARIKGEHLAAANEPIACRSCTGTCGEGRRCPYSAETAMGTLRVFARTFGPYVLVVLAALLWAAVPVFLDGEGPQPAATATTGSAP